MKFWFRADLRFDSFRELKADFFLQRNLKVLLVDLDNTLAPYRQPEPDEDVIQWVSEMKRNGIRVLIFSNNTEKRVSRFCKDLECEWMAMPRKPHKPGKEAYEIAVNRMQSEKKCVAAIGDQVFIDTLGARRFGIPVFLVRPVQLKGYPLYALRRVAEWPFVWMTPKGNN